MLLCRGVKCIIIFLNLTCANYAMLNRCFYSNSVFKQRWLQSRYNKIWNCSIAKCTYNEQPQRRCLASISGWFRNDNDFISKAVLDAEKIIGYRTSYLSLRALLSDELTSIAMHVKQLAASKHPLLSTARGILFDSEHSVQARGLVVLLLSKMLTHDLPTKQLDVSKAIVRQRSLAELTELIHVGFLIHRGIIDRRHLLEQSKNLSEMEIGNKMSVLSGDFLFAHACVALSELENSQVVSLMSSSIGDMSQGYFIIPESGDFSAITSLDDLPSSLEDWQKTMYLAHGSLLSNACRSSSVLLGVEDKYGEACAQLGKCIILALQARTDVDRMRGKVGRKAVPQPLELCTLPVMIAAEERGGSEWVVSFLQRCESGDWKFKKDELMRQMKSCNRAFDDAEEVCRSYMESAMEALQQLPGGEAHTALHGLIRALS